MGFYTSGALLSDARLTGHTGASTNQDIPRLPTLELNHYGVSGNLPAAEMSGTDTISNDTLIYTDPLIATLLPALKLTAQFGEIIQSISGGMLLPAMELSSFVGAVMTGLLSSPSVSATASRPTLMSLAADLPALELSSRTGARCGTLILPQMELSISATGYIVGSLSLSMPGFSISATGSSATMMSLDQDLPSLTLAVSMNGRVAGNLSKSMPALMISATASANEYGTLAASLPSLILSAGTGHGASMTLDAEIATLIMQILASGTSAGTGSASSASNASRFTDYVLRHAR